MRPCGKTSSPSVRAAAQASVPNSMRSGSTVWTAPPSSAPPSMVRTCVPRPAILAPIAIRQAARSAISGSRAALRMVVVPVAATAASRRFSVAPTEGWGSRISAPRRPSRRRRADRAVAELDRGAHGAQARDMEIDAAQADGIAARHRQRRLAAAGQQGAEQQHRGAHAGDQLGIDALRLHAIGRDRHGEARRRLSTNACRSPGAAAAPPARRHRDWPARCAASPDAASAAPTPSTAARRSWRR